MRFVKVKEIKFFTNSPMNQLSSTSGTTMTFSNPVPTIQDTYINLDKITHFSAGEPVNNNQETSLIYFNGPYNNTGNLYIIMPIKILAGLIDGSVKESTLEVLYDEKV